jgi:predicted component of type VI protein secretion system
MENGINDVAVLIGLDGIFEGKRWILNDEDFVIGRSPECQLVVPDRQVSRQHARLIKKSEAYVVEDLGSKNGTHVNGVLIREPTALQDGDEIQVALAVKLAFLGSEATVQLAFPSGGEGKLQIDVLGRKVVLLGEELDPPLSAAQYQLLELLYRNESRVVSREEVISVVWPDTDPEGVSEQAIDALVRRLRDRLSQVDTEHSYVVTVRGYGFRLDNPTMD